MLCPFALILAPPAAGKTTRILEVIKSNSFCLFVSPLRALADEVIERAIINGINVIEKNDPIDTDRSNLIVLTPEQFPSFLPLRFERLNPLVIVDEVHLCVKWGKSFRPWLLDFFVDLFSVGNLVLGLSATWDKECQLFMSDLQKYYLDSFLILFNEGNMKLKYHPRYKLITPKMIFPLLVLLHQHFLSKKCLLIFCRYRSEVAQIQSLLERLGLNSLGCLGGEVGKFREELSDRTRLIVATSVLSHGVNLPEIDMVIFTHKVEDKALQLQMIARAGRRGKSYVAIELREFRAFLFDLFLMGSAHCKIRFRCLKQWVLKKFRE